MARKKNKRNNRKAKPVSPIAPRHEKINKTLTAPPSEELSEYSIWENPIFSKEAPAIPSDTMEGSEDLTFQESSSNESPGGPFFIIRKCQISDLEAICRMQADWECEEMDPFFIPSGKGELVARMSPYFLVAESEGKLLGFIYGIQKTSQGNPAISDGVELLEISRIYVVPDFRSGKVGGRLLEGLMEKAREEGIGKFMVSANTKDVERIAKFFHAHKFKALSVQFYR